MTVTYSRRVADARLGTFSHLLLRWRGSIYKLLYRELIIFTILYLGFSVLYRCVKTKVGDPYLTATFCRAIGIGKKTWFYFKQ